MADVEAPGGEKWEHLKSGGKQWQATTKNLPRMQRTRAIPVAWLNSGLCPDRPKGWIPIIIIIIIIICQYIPNIYIVLSGHILDRRCELQTTAVSIGSACGWSRLCDSAKVNTDGGVVGLVHLTRDGTGHCICVDIERMDKGIRESPSWQWPGHECELVMHVKAGGGSFMSISLYCILNLLGRSFCLSTRKPIYWFASHVIGKISGFEVYAPTTVRQRIAVTWTPHPTPPPTSPSSLIFLWPCIMNWLNINYQLDALIIIYS